jgi:hypothetical protein
LSRTRASSARVISSSRRESVETVLLTARRARHLSVRALRVLIHLSPFRMVSASATVSSTLSITSPIFVRSIRIVVKGLTTMGKITV